jgi:hypothetical protein
MKRNQNRWFTYSVLTLLLFTASTAASQAADFNLAWDPPVENDANLIGYHVYYKAGSSILTDPSGSIMIYVPLSEEGFDPSSPSFLVTDLLDDTTYYFTVSAVYDEDESAMSNQVEGINGNSTPTSAIETSTSGSSAGSGGGGCFIKTLAH